MNALLIAGTDPNGGQGQLTRVLGTYWQHYRSPQPLGQLTLSAPLKVEQTWHQLTQLRQAHAGVLLTETEGFGCCLAKETTVADLAWDWRLPTVLLVSVRPGAIGQAVAHVALARQCRCHLRGLVLSCPQPEAMAELENWASRSLIRSLTQVPVLGILPPLEAESDPEKLLQVASALDLERLLIF